MRAQAGRETAILRNRLYIGELVRNRCRWLKDPGTSRRVAHPNDEQVLVTEQVPNLRIIEQPLGTRSRHGCKPRLAQNAHPPRQIVPIISGTNAARGTF